jgi:transcriptional regulator with XRE-family HTH domain
MELKLSQKDVAQKINEKPSVLQDYESGKAIPNPQILGKLERVLGVKLRGMSFDEIDNILMPIILPTRCRHWKEDGGAEKVVIDPSVVAA